MSGEDELPRSDYSIYRELVRIFGENPISGSGLLLLPLLSDADALEFLRGIPAGTQMSELGSLATAFRATHPLRATMVDGDVDDRSV